MIRISGWCETKRVVQGSVPSGKEANSSNLLNNSGDEEESPWYVTTRADSPTRVPLFFSLSQGAQTIVGVSHRGLGKVGRGRSILGRK